MQFLAEEVGAGRRTRTPDLLITKIEKTVRTLILQRFRAIFLVGADHLKGSGPLCPLGLFTVWVMRWVKMQKGQYPQQASNVIGEMYE